MVETESDVRGVLADLLADHPGSVYPVIAWFEPETLRRSRWINEAELEEAAGNLELLDELIACGLPRLFLDEEFADLLADHADSNALRDWIERAAVSSPNVMAQVRG
ncbi:MAG: hypothetical protein ABIQ10_08965 [Gemmatimonadaceae bacterium]